MSAIQGLTLDERNELARKFKYYFSSVRPNQRPNRVSTINGSYFALNTELQLVSSIPRNGELRLEFFLLMSFVDDRLEFRALTQRFQMSPEYRPWLPDVSTYPSLPLNISIFLEPRHGVVTAIYKVNSMLPCFCDRWRHPFENFYCDLIISNNGDERIILRNVLDLRSNLQKAKVSFSWENWPQVMLRYSFAHKWHSSLVTSILPSMLVFCVVVFAQWKRRKVQVLVTATALLCIVILQSTHRSSNSITLEDLWLSCTFLHIVCVLLVDLTLPARRVRYNVIVGDSFNKKCPSVNGHITLFKSKPVVIEQQLSRSGSVGSELLSGKEPIQRQITTTSIGKRKRIALSSIVICYILFVIIYISFVLSIVFSYL